MCKWRERIEYFSFNFCMMTFDDLSKVKQGHCQRGSILGLHLHGMDTKSWKFHYFTLIGKVIKIGCLFMTSRDQPMSTKVKPERVPNQVWIFIVWLIVLQSFTIILQFLKEFQYLVKKQSISGTGWPLNTTQRSTEVTHRIYRHQVYLNL